MDNYKKGKNIEEPFERDKIPLPGLPAQFIWMQVNGGTKMRNVLDYALKAFKDERAIVWSGSGAGVGKAISCAEIMKRRNKEVHQINKICFRKIEEFWEPQLEDLDPLVVVREIPTIHILLSKDTLNTEEPGYQAPGSCDVFGVSNQPRRSGPSNRGVRPSRVSSEQFSALGLRSRARHNKQRSGTGSDRTNSNRPANKGDS
ncbi:ribonuclease P protein subunit p25-like protein [Anabrus simplex]|uniref:ribonuclease P protein subunit p25-like protein n=1 Tax=Anabrus simplex TaxID=316456 RepID=UPI0034DDC97D